MNSVRAIATTLKSKGVISAGWYSILTGVALLYVAYALGSGPEDDPAAAYVAVVLALVGVWQLEKGLRAEFQRRRPD